MSDKDLTNYSDSDIVSLYTSKPDFLDIDDENTLIEYIKNDEMKKFFELGGELIQNTRDVTNLYAYIKTKLNRLGIEHEEITRQTCWRLFQRGSIGWLNIYDPRIIEYCREHGDEELQKELKGIEPVEWFQQYKEYVELEKKIMYEIEMDEDEVKEYYTFLKKKHTEEAIPKDTFDEALDRLIEELSIYKDRTLIGRLISPSLQKELDVQRIAPKVEIKTLTSKYDL